MNDRVCAVVVAYNRKTLLHECITALQGQTRAVDEILVCDNASTDGTGEMLRAEFPQVRVVSLAKNVGGAGGFHVGMKAAYERGFDWIWVMDDDARPAPDCLEKLLEYKLPNAVMVPLQQDSDGRKYGIALWNSQEVDTTALVEAYGRPAVGDLVFRFVGPLFAREVIGRAGLPNGRFFIWFDDLEYSLRIKSKTDAEIIAVPEAIVFHDFGGKSREVRFLGKRSIRNQQPAWKLYYGTRNYLYTITRTRRKPLELLLFALIQTRFLAGEIAFEPDRWERVRMRLLGVRDGVKGRLGKRI